MRNKGITLIALVITIIVLLILAGVTIATLFGENGIITMAQKAKEETEDAAKEEQQLLAGAFEKNFVTYNGQLHVEGTKLMNEHNEEIRLKGTVLLNSSNLEFNKDKLKTLKDWGVNVIKVGLNNSSSSTPYTDQQQMEKMYQIINDAIDLDLYVIVIFWSDSDELTEEIQNQANEYFLKIATKYKDIPNLIYEIGNEPQEDWENIKIYANDVISNIRAISNQSIILCPTKGHNGVDWVIGNKLDYQNIMYVAHIYAGNRDDCYYISNAILNGVPVFISEWSNGGGDGTQNEQLNELTDNFVSLMDRYNLSSTFFIFSESNREDSLATIKTNMWNNSWTEDSLTETGLYAKKFFEDNYEEYKYDVSDYTLRKLLRLNALQEWQNNYKITNILTKNNFKLSDIPENVEEIKDVSNGSGNLIAYIVNNGDNTFSLYIVTLGEKIYAVNNSEELFRNFSYVNTIDLSYMDTSYVENLSKWFANDSNLKQIIGFEKLNLSNVTNIESIFAYCSSLEKIYLTNISSEMFTAMSMSEFCYGIKSGIEIYVKDIEMAKLIKEDFSSMNRQDEKIYYYFDGSWIEYIE